MLKAGCLFYILNGRSKIARYLIHLNSFSSLKDIQRSYIGYWVLSLARASLGEKRVLAGISRIGLLPFEWLISFIIVIENEFVGIVEKLSHSPYFRMKNQ